MDFMQEDIPPATTDLKDNNALTNLWAQKIFTDEELSTLLHSSLDIDIEPQYDALTQRLSAINRKMWDAYRLSTFLVHANNSHKHPARALITDTFEATRTGSTTIRTLIGELEKQAEWKAARATRNSKGAQSENRTQTSSASPPKIETIPHTFSIGTWLLDATKNITRARKTARKTTSINPLSQTTIDEFYRTKTDDDEVTKSKRLKDGTHTVDTNAFTTATIDKEKPTPLPRTWAEFQRNPDQYRHHPTWDLLSPAEFYEKVCDWDWNEIDEHIPTATMHAKERDTTALTTDNTDSQAETINLIGSTLAMCKKDIPGSISMIVDSGASHILLRQEHAQVLHNFTCDNSKTRSYPHGYRHGFTNHRTISHPGLHMPQPRVTTLFTKSIYSVLSHTGH
jgi:hypothetical protein